VVDQLLRGVVQVPAAPVVAAEPTTPFANLYQQQLVVPFATILVLLLPVRQFCPNLTRHARSLHIQLFTVNSCGLNNHMGIRIY